jgi:hypothetical protein
VINNPDISRETLGAYAKNELLYSGNSINRQMNTDNFGSIDLDLLKRRVQLAKAILTLPNLPGGPSREPMTLPGGWRNDVDAIAASQVEGNVTGNHWRSLPNDK